MDEFSKGEPIVIHDSSKCQTQCKCNQSYDLESSKSLISLIEKFNPLPFWILLFKERNLCRLVDLEEVEILLPNYDSVTNKSVSYNFKTHSSLTLVDHYWTEISKLFPNEGGIFCSNNKPVLAQITCLPSGSNVILHTLDDETYNAWLAARNDNQLPLTENNIELIFELQNLKNVIVGSKDKVINSILKFIESKSFQSYDNIENNIKSYIENIECTQQKSEKICTGLIDQYLLESANKMKDAKTSLISITQLNDYLVCENAFLANKCVQLYCLVKHGNINEINRILENSDNVITRSNERLCNKLAVMQNTMNELLSKLQKCEKANVSLCEQLLKTKLASEQQKLLYNKTLSDSKIEISQLKRDIWDKDNTIIHAIDVGKILYDDSQSIKTLLKDMGKEIDINQNEINFEDYDALIKLMNIFRNFINELSRTILAIHNKSEAKETHLNNLKQEFSALSNESMNLYKEVTNLTNQANVLQNENDELSKKLLHSEEDNSLIQEQLSQSNYRNILLHEQLVELQKQSVVKDVNLEIQKCLDKTNTNFLLDCTNDIKKQMDDIINEKHCLLDRIHDAEIRVHRVQETLERNEQVLDETKKNYESYLYMVKNESDDAISELKKSLDILKQNFAQLQEKNTSLNDQVENLRKENAVLVNNRNDDVSNSECSEVTELSEVVARLRKENADLKSKIQKIKIVNDIFNDSDMSFESEIQNLKENHLNGVKIKELQTHLEEKEQAIKSLLNDGHVERKSLERLEEKTLQLRKELSSFKRLIKENKIKKTCSNESQNSKNAGKSSNCSVNKEYCKKDISAYRYSSKTNKKDAPDCKDESHRKLLTMEKELSLARKTLLEHEKHVKAINEELEKQVKLIETTTTELMEKKKLEERISQDTKQISEFIGKLNEREAEICVLKEELKYYKDCYTVSLQNNKEWKMKFETAEQSLTNKQTIIKNMENDRKLLEELSTTYSTLASNLTEEQRKVKELEEQLIKEKSQRELLEGQLSVKENLLQMSYGDVQIIKRELSNLKTIFFKNTEAFDQLKWQYDADVLNLEFNLKRSNFDKVALADAFSSLQKDRNKLQIEYNALCNTLITAIQSLMSNQFDDKELESEIKNLNEIFITKIPIKKL